MMNTPTTDPFKRLPVPSTAPPPYSPYEGADIIDDYLNDHHDQGALVANTGNLSLQNAQGENGHERPSHQNAPLILGERPPMLPRPATTVPLITSTSNTPAEVVASTPDTPTTSKSFWQNAVDETLYFAGGLVSHPVESTKHFSILRHSSGLIFYKGSETSVVITIFADAPLPADRSLWLQRKGYSGNLGMNASALLRTSTNWIDVTPVYEALPSDMPEADERAWQRDMTKFVKKASKEKHLSKQTARETCVVRIPASAEDGYLRIVLCTGEGRKKVLCPSPVFRVASTSTDVSVFRGASLTTMPLEAGLKAASVIGTTVANRYIGPAKMVVQSRVGKVAGKLTEKHKPGFVVQKAEHIALAKSHVKTTFNTLEQNFDGARDVLYNPLHAQNVLDSPPEVIGPDSGPESPFPLRLDGKVMQGTGQGQVQTGTPTANLTDVADDLLLRLNGIYIGWASVQPMRGLSNVSHDWHESIITIGPSPYAAPHVVPKNVATVHIIHDFGSEAFLNTKLKVVVMAYLRPMPKPDKTAASQEHVAEAVARDISISLASLSREHWGHEIARQRIKDAKRERGITDKYVDARVQIQKRVDSVPLHKAGIRTAGVVARDKAHGNGGIWIRR